jgi:DNA-binding Lrp family transcriptional regulator
MHEKKTTMQTNMNFPTYVFATVNPGRTTNVVAELKQISQIDLIAPVTGRYDLVLRLKPNTPHNIYQTVKEIRNISDIRTTDTHTGFDGMQPTKKLESQMALGFSLLNVQHNTAENTIKQLSNIPGFIEASTVPGQFDIVALWQARTSEEIVKASFEKVSNLEGVFSSETLLAHVPFFKA